MPSARFEIAEIAATRRPQWRATAVSCTVDIPTASAPSVAKARISAAVSKVGPDTARYTPSASGVPSSSAAARRPARSSGS